MNKSIFLIAILILSSLSFALEPCPTDVQCCNEPYYEPSPCQDGYTCANHICRLNNAVGQCEPCMYDMNCKANLFCYNSRCQPYQFSDECKVCSMKEYYVCQGTQSEHGICNSNGYGYNIDKKQCYQGCDSNYGRCVEDINNNDAVKGLILFLIGLIIIIIILVRRFKK